MKNKIERDSENIQWEIEVSIFRSIVILKDLGIALGIPFGILIIILLIVSDGDISTNGIGYPLIFIGTFFLIAFFFIMIVYSGKYAAGYVIDRKGILNYTGENQSKKNKAINILLVFMGILSGKPFEVGAGILAQSRQSVFIKWSSIRKVKVYPKSKSIVIKGGFAEKIALFCNGDNFDLVKDTVINKVNMDGE